jgi:diadenosine tetraphosphate (Ap4A) HIT family hydrolase
MIGPRTRKELLRYLKHLRQKDPSTCDFCGITKDSPRVIEQTKSFQIIHNDYPYSLWDAQGVIDHLMIVPIKHIDDLGAMTKDEKIEFVDLLTKYDDKGYNIYARALSSAVRTIGHQHTHLIKTTGKIKSFFLMFKKPFFRIVK